tara:strand:+ start:481 stop:1191 length:711 start_codon:yes stop_codon:yes gene_type:complete
MVSVLLFFGIPKGTLGTFHPFPENSFPDSGKKPLFITGFRHVNMAKSKNDLILRDRLQFDVDAAGDAVTVYGRIDLSDYVNVVSLEGLSIKEIRYQLRDPNAARTGVPTQPLIISPASVGSMKLYATTSAYESAVDVGIASPNLISCVTISSYREAITGAGGDTYASFGNEWVEWSTPDLHPAGYPVVTDVLIGIAAENCNRYADTTMEVDIMLIAEPIKLSKDDLNDMLIQAQDL